MAPLGFGLATPNVGNIARHAKVLCKARRARHDVSLGLVLKLPFDDTLRFFLCEFVTLDHDGFIFD